VKFPWGFAVKISLGIYSQNFTSYPRLASTWRPVRPRNHGLAGALLDPQIPCMRPTKRTAARHGAVLCGGTERMCRRVDRSAARDVHCAIFEIQFASFSLWESWRRFRNSRAPVSKKRRKYRYGTPGYQNIDSSPIYFESDTCCLGSNTIQVRGGSRLARASCRILGSHAV
jgi:hypothetical protein